MSNLLNNKELSLQRFILSIFIREIKESKYGDKSIVKWQQYIMNQYICYENGHIHLMGMHCKGLKCKSSFYKNVEQHS